jgi:hypothetical protein
MDKCRKNGKSEEVVADPDPLWKDLYKAGGISAFLYVVLGLIVPAVLLSTSNYNPKMDGAAILEFIASNREWWIVVQTLTLGSPVFSIITFTALYLALKHLNRSYAAIGVLIAIATQLLFLAYFPVVMGLLYLSDQYATASDAQRLVFVSAADGLVAQNNAFGPSETMFAISILILSLVMLRGVFHRGVAYLGIATFAAAIVGQALQPVVGIAYFWWWLLFMIWFTAIGWKLYKLGD